MTAKLNGFLVGGVLLLFLPVSEWVYSLWTTRKLSLDITTLSLLTAQTILWSLWSSSSTVLYATNRQGRLTLVLLMNALVAVGISWVIVPRMGIIGAALAALGADVICAAWVAPRTACSAIGDSFFSHMREVLSAMCIGVVVPLLAGIGLWWVLPYPSIRPFVVLPAASVLGLGLMWVTLTDGERRLARLVLGRLKGRFARG